MNDGDGLKRPSPALMNRSKNPADRWSDVDFLKLPKAVD